MNHPAQTDPTRPRSIALIDLSYLFKKRFHQPDQHEPAKATLADIEWLSAHVDQVIICRDAPPYKRAEVYVDYKAHRPKPEPEELAQKRWLLGELQRLGYAMPFVQGYEADDVIATLAKQYGQWCDDVRIVSSDKDAAQCITEHVHQFIPPVGDRDWEERDVQGVIGKFGVTPERFPFYQGLVGDSQDNIPGVEGIGKVKAVELVNKYGNLQGLAEAVAGQRNSFKPAVYASLTKNWNDLVLSIKLATLDTTLPLDPEAFLAKRKAPEPDPALEGEVDAAFEDAVKGYQERLPDLQAAAQASKDAEGLEEQYEEERRQNEEHVEAEVVTPPPPKPKTAAVERTVPAYTKSNYGLVTSDLQPVDLSAAYKMAEWFHASGLFPAFKTVAAVFSILVLAKELRIGAMAALRGIHMVEGKPTISADLIRALAERDPTFEYLYPIEQSPTRCVWVGKKKGQPELTFPYTIEDAKQAGLATPWTKGNWVKRPQDMLTKTAGSKLARLLWAGATHGLYCPEEFGYTMEDLNAREAA